MFVKNCDSYFMRRKIFIWICNRKWKCMKWSTGKVQNSSTRVRTVVCSGTRVSPVTSLPLGDGPIHSPVLTHTVSMTPPCSRAIQAKGEIVPVLNYIPRHEEIWRSGDVTPHILNLGTRRRRVISFTPGERAPVPTGQKAVWVPGSAVRFLCVP
jgi:hypothetical protein